MSPPGGNFHHFKDHPQKEYAEPHYALRMIYLVRNVIMLTVDKKLRDHINFCYETTKLLWLLRQLASVVNSKEETDKKSFTFATRDVPLRNEDSIACLKDLATQGVILLPNLKEELQHGSLPSFSDENGENRAWYYLITFTVREGKDLNEEYKKALQEKVRQLNQEKELLPILAQSDLLSKELLERAEFMQRKDFNFSFQDIKSEKVVHINLYVTLLYMESEKDLQLMFHPLAFEDISDKQPDPLSIIFDINLSFPIIQGGWFEVDLNDRVIRYTRMKHKEEKSFEYDSPAYKLLKLFFAKGVEKLSRDEVLEEFRRVRQSDTDQDKGKSVEKILEDARAAIGPDGISSGKHYDIFRNQRKYLHLRKSQPPKI